MKKLLSAFAAAGFGLLLAPPAIAEEVCGASYMTLPTGHCLNLNYMGVLGKSRAELAEINREYQEEFDVNLALEMDDWYRLLETEEERDARISNLAETGMIRDEMDTRNQGVERAVSPYHVQAVGIVYDAYYQPELIQLVD